MVVPSLEENMVISHAGDEEVVAFDQHYFYDEQEDREARDILGIREMHWVRGGRPSGRQTRSLSMPTMIPTRRAENRDCFEE